MRVKMQARPGFVFQIKDKRYFLLEFEGSFFAVLDSCPHRGGPLSKGIIDNCRGTITCPMHELKTSIKFMIKSSLPLIKVGNEVVVISIRVSSQ